MYIFDRSFRSNLRNLCSLRNIMMLVKGFWCHNLGLDNKNKKIRRRRRVEQWEKKKDWDSEEQFYLSLLYFPWPNIWWINNKLHDQLNNHTAISPHFPRSQTHDAWSILHIIITLYSHVVQPLAMRVLFQIGSLELGSTLEATTPSPLVPTSSATST